MTPSESGGGRKVRALFLGHCSYFHTKNISGLLRKEIPGLHITVANLVKPDGSELLAHETGDFDKVMEFPRKRNISPGGPEILSGFFSALSDRTRRGAVLSALFRLKPGKVKKLLNSYIENEKFSGMLKDAISGYDILHFHFISAEALIPLALAGKDQFVILHFWGSDLLNMSGKEIYLKQNEAIDRADMILLTTPEMTEHFLVKFGRDKLDKIRNVHFAVDNDFLDRILKSDRVKHRDEFCRKNGISGDKIIIEAGYNASVWQRHLRIIEELKKLPPETRKRVHVIFVMTYGLGPEHNGYLKEVKNAAEGAGIDYTFFEKYLDKEEVLRLIAATDIKLNLRETDNMNNAMLEAFCSDTVVVNGSWMPYGSLRRKGVYYREIGSLDELPGELTYLCSNLQSEKIKTSGNGRIIEEEFSYAKLSSDWTAVYEEAMKRAKVRKQGNANN